MMFADESARLLREDWDDAKALAEELVALFTTTANIRHAGGLTIEGRGTDPNITLLLPSGGDTNAAIRIQKFDGTTSDIVFSSPLSISHNGGKPSPIATRAEIQALTRRIEKIERLLGG